MSRVEVLVAGRSAGARVDLPAIAQAASEEAGGVPPALLGDYLFAVADAAASGRRLASSELAGYAAAGERAAEAGVELRGLVDLYLSATWRLWRELPADAAPAGHGSAASLRAAGLAVLRAADDAVAAAAEGFERARLSAARREEAQRRALFDDLLSGRGRAGELIARGERLGLRLAGPHQVVLAGPGTPGGEFRGPDLELEEAVRAAAAHSLAATRGSMLVAITGAVGRTDGGERVAGALARVLAAQGGGQAGGRRAGTAPAAGPAPAGPAPAGATAAGTTTATAAGPTAAGGTAARRPWRIVIGRAYTGPAGVVRSFEEAAEALEVAQHLGLPEPVSRVADLLLYQVLARDRPALTDLVEATLAPLASARGGPGPLLATLAAYFAHGGVATAAARDLHLSVRAVTYRLARVRELTGRDPADPADALVLRVAVVGAQLLDWRATPVPGAAAPAGPVRQA